MKIFLLHYSAPPVVGGVESVIGHHARLMVGAGHKVSVIAGRGDAFDRRVQFVKIPLVDSRHSSILKAKTVLDSGKVPGDFEALVEDIASRLEPALKSADVLIAHNVCSLHKNLALTAALYKLFNKKTKPRLILWHHDLAWTSGRYQKELHNGYPWDLIRKSWNAAVQVVVSEQRRNELAELTEISREQIKTIPNGIDIPAFFRLASMTQGLLEKLDLLAANPLLLLPVRITKRKNIELALNTLAELRKTYPDAALVVTGPLGPHNPANMEYFTDLKKIREGLGLGGSAHFLAEIVDGYLPDVVIADFYRLADALFFPSREEGFGIPILEAGVSGIAIFSSNIETLRALGGSEVSYFTPDEDPQKVATQIAGVLEKDNKYRLRARVRPRFSWQAIYEQHITPLLETIA